MKKEIKKRSQENCTSSKTCTSTHENIVLSGNALTVLDAVHRHDPSIQELVERIPRGSVVAALAVVSVTAGTVVARRMVQVKPHPTLDAENTSSDILLDRRSRPHDAAGGGHGAVAPHVAAERLADGELEAADGAAV